MVSSSSFAVSVYKTPDANTPPGAMTTTSSDGHFELMPTEQPDAIVVRSAAGYAAAIMQDPAKPMSISVAPWARVEGVVRRGSKAVPNARVLVAQYGDQADWDRWHVSKEQQVQCDENGQFVVDRVVPGMNRIGRVDARNPMPQRQYSVDLPPGKTTVVNIGGDGRTLVGHLPPAAVAFSSRWGTVQIPQPKMPQPPDWDKLDEAQKKKLQQAFWNTPPYKAWQQSANVAQFDAKWWLGVKVPVVLVVQVSVTILMHIREGHARRLRPLRGTRAPAAASRPRDVHRVESPNEDARYSRLVRCRCRAVAEGLRTTSRLDQTPDDEFLRSLGDFF